MYQWKPTHWLSSLRSGECYLPTACQSRSDYRHRLQAPGGAAAEMHSWTANKDMLSGSRKVCKRPLQQNIRSAAQRERLQAEEFRLITSNLVQRSILCVSFSPCEKTLLKEVPQAMYRTTFEIRSPQIATRWIIAAQHDIARLKCSNREWKQRLGRSNTQGTVYLAEQNLLEFYSVQFYFKHAIWSPFNVRRILWSWLCSTRKRNSSFFLLICDRHFF